MPSEPSGVSIFSPKISDAALVRKFVSLGGTGYVAISIQDNLTGSQAIPIDPDPDTLQVDVWFNDVLTGPIPDNPYGTQILTITADSINKDSVGHYYCNLGPDLTSNRGLITAVWTYKIHNVPFQFTDHLQVLDSMPLYDSLSDREKLVVEQVSWMFGDLYDSTDGGPHLIEEFQTHWNYERLAQMQAIAVQRMNFIGNFANPPTTWSVGSGSKTSEVPGKEVTVTQTMPDGSSIATKYHTQSSVFSGGTGAPANFHGLAVLGTYLECMRHLRDSYTEVPQRPGMDVTYVDRTAYQQRWASNLQTEQQEWVQAVKNAKKSLLNLSRGSLLVAGGIYGGGANTMFIAGQYSASVRSMRFYPSIPTLSWNAATK